MTTAALNIGPSFVPPNPGPDIITVSEVMLDAIADADRHAVRGYPVLIMGETGTGKELLARRIHARSGRRGDLVPVNCAELRPEQATNLLFGHRRGSYTGATENTTGYVRRSARGTLFLDEVTSLPLESQPMLLRVLETGEVTPYGDDRVVHVDLRVVAAAQPTLRTMLSSGAARLDLFERLAVSTVMLPPLRERPNDIWPLAVAFAAAHGVRLHPGAAAPLLDHAWPGNVRELKSVIHRATALASGSTIGAAATESALKPSLAMMSDSGEPSQFERGRQELQALCVEAEWDAKRLMKVMGVSRATMYRRLADFNIRLREGRRSHFVSRILETK